MSGYRARAAARATAHLAAAAVACLAFGARRPAHAAVLFINPDVDRHDRIEEILSAAQPRPELRTLEVNGSARKPEHWQRAIGDAAPVALGDVKLVILESVPASALREIASPSHASLLDALGPWVEGGGHLLIVGGAPSFETYVDTPLARLLPAAPRDSGWQEHYVPAQRRPISGSRNAGLAVRHLHRVGRVRGEVLMRAGEEPFAIRVERGRGRVTVVLGGATGRLLYADHFPPDDYFASPAWDAFLLERVGDALGRRYDPGARPDYAADAPHFVRVGATIDPLHWFGERLEGRLSLVAPWGAEVYRTRVWEKSRPKLPRKLRPGRYRAVLDTGERVLERDLVLALAPDPADFDLRLWHLSSSPYPVWLAPGEALARARALRAAGFTSAVLVASGATRPDIDLPVMREILAGGLNIVYYRSFGSTAFYPDRWPGSRRVPPVAVDLDGEPQGWDIHSEAFRNAVDHAFDGFEAVTSLPGIRALHVIEENRDGGLRSPSLAERFRALGLSGREKPGDPGWLLLEDVRSGETRITYARYRAMARRFLPGVRLATYWPGSYWAYANVYGHRVPDFAAAFDELLGPAYGYENEPRPWGWLSVVHSTSEIFSALDFERTGERGIGIYIQGTRISDRGGRKLGFDTWRESGWTALATGATQLAYYHIPYGRSLERLAPLHAEWHRIGPWLAAAPRRVAPIAVLQSWSTRNGSHEETTLRHRNCSRRYLESLVYAIEEVDVVGERQLASLPPEIRAIVVSAAPILPAMVVDDLVAFVRAGGHLFIDPRSGARHEEGTRGGDPFHAVRGSGRVHDLDGIGRCNDKGRLDPASLVGKWRRQLSRIGISPTSVSPASFTQARMLGEGDVRYWVFLNHTDQTRKVRGVTRIDEAGWLWRDLRSGELATPRAHPGAATGTTAVVSVASGDAAVWGGSRRPTAHLAVDPQVDRHEVRVVVSALDDQMRAAPDHTPLRLHVRDSRGGEPLDGSRGSRVVRDGSVTWVVPIPADEPGGDWTFSVEAPISRARKSVQVKIPGPDGLDASPRPQPK